MILLRGPRSNVTSFRTDGKWHTRRRKAKFCSIRNVRMWCSFKVRPRKLIKICMLRNNSYYCPCGIVEFLAVGPRIPGFDSQRHYIFWVSVSLEWGPTSLTWINEEVSSGFGLETRDKRPWWTAALATRHPSIRKSWHKIRRQGRQLV
jgi:hypothetical protein